MTYFSLKDITAVEIIYRGIGGHGVGESILELYREYLEMQGTKVTLKTNGLKVTIERDLEP